MKNPFKKIYVCRNSRLWEYNEYNKNINLCFWFRADEKCELDKGKKKKCKQYIYHLEDLCSKK